VVSNACMMQSLEFWVSPTMHQTMACTDGLDGCDLVRLIILSIWKILFGIRQDHKKVECEDFPYTT
jgi:hypothetical protein